MTPSKLKVVDLRKELQKRGLSAAGLKPALISRLQEALSSEPLASKPIDDVNSSDSEGVSEDSIEIEIEEFDRTHKRRRKSEVQNSHIAVNSSEVAQTDSTHDFSAEVQRLIKELSTSRKEIERLHFCLEEAKERVEVVKLEGRREAELDFEKERVEARQALTLAKKKHEEIEFKLCQKEEEVQMLSKAKQSEQQDQKLTRQLRDEIKKKEMVQFEKEQLREQFDQCKQQNRALQQQIEASRALAEMEKREKERLLLEERGKTEQFRLRLDGERDKLINEWRKEYADEIAEQKELLNKRLKETEKTRKELTQQQAALENTLAERTHAELQRLSLLEEDLRRQEKFQEEMQEFLDERQRNLTANEDRLEADEQRLREERVELATTMELLEKEKADFDERMWIVDKEAKRMQEKLTELEFKNMNLNAENRELQENGMKLHQQVQRHKSRASMIPLPIARPEANPLTTVSITPTTTVTACEAVVVTEVTSKRIHKDAKENIGMEQANRIPPPTRSASAKDLLANNAPKSTSPQKSLNMAKEKNHRRSMIPVRRGSSVAFAAK